MTTYKIGQQHSCNLVHNRLQQAAWHPHQALHNLLQHQAKRVLIKALRVANEGQAFSKYEVELWALARPMQKPCNRKGSSKGSKARRQALQRHCDRQALMFYISMKSAALKRNLLYCLSPSSVRGCLHLYHRPDDFALSPHSNSLKCFATIRAPPAKKYWMDLVPFSTCQCSSLILIQLQGSTLTGTLGRYT